MSQLSVDKNFFLFCFSLGLVDGVALLVLQLHSIAFLFLNMQRCSSNANFRKIDSERARFGSNWLDHWMEDNVCSKTSDAPSLKNGHPDDEKSAKILEVDTWKPRFNSHRSSSSFQTAHHYLSSDHNNENLMAYESPSKRSTKALINQSLSSREVASARTADNSPQAFSASSRTGNGARKGPFTPTRSECSWGFFSGYSGYPNYMANTESFRAKVRSQSAPRQRLEFERYNSSSRSTRRPFQGLREMVPNSDWDSDSRSNKVSPASSRLNRIGSSTNLR